MTTWVLIWVVSAFIGPGGNYGVATGTAIFHSQAACQEAAKGFRSYTTAFCTEDAPISEDK